MCKALMATRRVVLFTDNEAVRTGKMKGNFKNHLVDCLMKKFFQVEEEIGCQIWLERVPGKSNPAGQPSRQICEEFSGSKERRRADVMDV